MCLFDTIKKAVRMRVLLLCALTLLVNGCVSLEGSKRLPPTPRTTGAMVHDGYICIPEQEAAELLLWIEYAEQQCP